MSIPPVVPVPGADPIPGIGEPPPVPVSEPEPDRLPDEQPIPNPDENPRPPQQAHASAYEQSPTWGMLCSASDFIPRIEFTQKLFHRENIRSFVKRWILTTLPKMDLRAKSLGVVNR